MITDDIELCIDALNRGELVAFPTETVFGLGARADSAAAVQKIFDLKSRPEDHPLILHCANIDVALAISPYVPVYATQLAREFWPGPMTLIFKRAQSDAVCDLALGGHDTVAIRVPSNEIARKFLEPCGFFVAAPSANKFGHVSPTTAQHVHDEFGEEILILNGERSEVGVESTIISCVSETPKILRAGAINSQDILRITGIESLDDEEESSNLKVASPGTLENHYSPNIALYVIDSEKELDAFGDVESTDCAFMSLTESQRKYKTALVVQNYDQFAFELYDFFRKAEGLGCKAIFVIAPENEGIGIAINDRLKRASKVWERANS